MNSLSNGNGTADRSTRNGYETTNGCHAPQMAPEADVSEPIAIIGFSLRFPQDAISAEAFWKMLLDKRNAMTEWPEERLNVEAFYHPDGTRKETFPLKGAHFLRESPEVFDAPFFSITSKEACSMDPQQRGLLESAYTALENAGIPMETAFGSKTSVFTGCFHDDYKTITGKDPETFPTYAATGLSQAMLANRISWFFNLTGASVNLDSACSSSMIALDMAVQSLRSSDSSMALVGGTNSILSPDSFLSLANMNFLSPDSLSYSFDSRGNGYSKGEGHCVVVLKTVSDAIKDGNTIRAVIRSTGSNQDGYTPGITQPSAASQESLILDTYKKAGLDMASTRYVEAHGTGTAVGDPLEASAIRSCFGSSVSGQPVYVGAVKSNIGHLEGASGLAGLIKTLMVLERGIIPPNANFKQLNPKIELNSSNVKIPEQCIPWPTVGLRRASVNCFGFGGANSHVVLDDAFHFLSLRGLQGFHCTCKDPPPPAQISNDGRLLDTPHYSGGGMSKSITWHAKYSVPRIFVFSAADEAGVSRLASSYSRYVADAALQYENPDLFLESLAYTLAVRRSGLSWKSFVLADDAGQLSAMNISAAARSKPKPNLGYVFTGQGAQFPGMGKELLAHPVFEASILKSAMYLQEFGCEWSFMDEILKDKSTSAINRPELSQPVCTVIQIAIVDLLKTIGLSPSTVIGHSSGEIAAAYCAGALSHRSAIQVAFFRGKYAGKLAATDNLNGSMLAVGLSPESVSKHLPSDGGVRIACINSPESVTLSGDAVPLSSIKVQLEKGGVFARSLMVDVAYHSHHMEHIADMYMESLSDLEAGKNCDIEMISSVTGKLTSKAQLCTADYWVRNMVSQVRFHDAVTKMAAGSTDTINGEVKLMVSSVQSLLEIGPHSALKKPIEDSLKYMGLSADITYYATMVRGRPQFENLFTTLGHLYCRGHPLSIDRLNRPAELFSNPIPTLAGAPEYPFNRTQKYWRESRLSKEGYRFRSSPPLDLLGTPAADWNPQEARWRRFMKVSQLPWIEDHVINNTAIYPATGMIVMAIEGIRQLAGESPSITGYKLEDITFHKPLLVKEGEDGVETELYLRSLVNPSDREHTWSEFRVFSFDGRSCTEHCRGRIRLDVRDTRDDVHTGKEAEAKLEEEKAEFNSMLNRCSRTINSHDAYYHLSACGFQYGKAFQALSDLSGNDFTESTACVRVFDPGMEDDSRHVQHHIIHPVTLDAAAQLMLVALTKTGKEKIPTTIPTRISKLWVSARGINCFDASSVLAYSKASFLSKRKAESRTVIFDASVQRILTIMDVETTAVATESNPMENSESAQLCYQFCSNPDIDFLRKDQLQAISSGARPDRVAPVKYFEALELAQVSLMSDAAGELSEQDIADAMPHIRLYIDWMKHKILESSKGDPVQNEIERLFQDKETLYQSVRDYNAQGRLFIEVGQNLSSILKGTVDPLQLLFNGDLAQKYYEACNRQVLCNEPLVRILHLISHKNPKLKILEVGAGTGAATTTVLEALAHENGTSRFTSYDYTDVSPVFFAAAEKEFREQATKINFRMLDIEYDPLPQGYEAGSYDIVIAGCVLHATKSLERSLRHVRSLLKPGGRLILYEIVGNADRIQFAFGLLSGWWLGEEKERSAGPCVGATTWNELLIRTGFSGVEVDIPDYLDTKCHEFSVMMSTAVGNEQILTDQSITLVIGANSPSHHGFAKELKDFLKQEGELSCDILTLQGAATNPPSAQSFCLFLTDFDQALLPNLSPSIFTQLQKFLTSSRSLLWVSSGDSRNSNPGSSMIEGFTRVLRSELNSLRLTTLALDPETRNNQIHCQNIFKVLKNTFLSSDAANLEPEYYTQNGIIHIRRLEEHKSLSEHVNATGQATSLRKQAFGHGGPKMMTIGTPGLLDSLEFVEDPEYGSPLQSSELELEVKATGINFRDCLTALGQIDGRVLGGECAGVVTRVGSDAAQSYNVGDRVVACEVNTIRTFARCVQERAAKIPDNMSFVEAASIPITFITAHYCFWKVARLQRGESVLIHLGAGGTGQAAIQVAQNIGAIVFTTVGSQKKKQMLIDNYGIPEDHIFYSRNPSFADGIKRKTKGRGVDVVLNSLSGDSMYASWDIVAPYGRFVEIGKKDVLDRSRLPMFNFSRNISFSVVDLSMLLLERPLVARESLIDVLESMEKGNLHIAKPLTVFGVGEAEAAFRSLQSGNNMGKIVVEMRPNDAVKTNLPGSCQIKGDASYLIAGGLGGLGRSVSRWMVSRGARNLVLLSRKGPQTQEALDTITDLRSRGVRVETPACDITSLESLLTILNQCAETMPPIQGCVQSSMVLKDAIFDNMSWDDWEASVSVKVVGSWNLHCLLPSNLDFFLFLSSVAGITGSGGQANYAAGNTYIDALAEYRLRHGQRATTLNLGWMAGEGVVAQNKILEQRLKAIGYFIPISTEQFHSILDYHCDVKLHSDESGLEVQSIIGLQTPSRIRMKGAERPEWMNRLTFCQMSDEALLNDSDSHGNSRNYSHLLQNATSIETCGSIVTEGLVGKISNSMSIPEQDIDTSQPLYEYGVDSLLAIEIRNWAMKECGAEVAVFEIVGDGSFEVVGATIAGKSKYCERFVKP